MSKFTAEEPASNYSTDDEELLTELAGVAGQGEITQLRHVRTNAEKRAAEEIASRTTCPDFDEFKPAFEQIKRELKFGIRQTRSLQTKALEEIQPGSYFIIGGQIAYIAEIGEELATAFHSRRSESRLRVIYDNGTESNVLQRSLQRALYRDEAARLITDPDPGPLFSGNWNDEDVESGTIYVLRSLSDHPFVTEHRELIHKIGVTGGNIGTRIANAALDATYLLAEVEVVASYKLAGINRTKLENLFHRIFASAQLDLTIHDRFGHPVRPREWFLVPLSVIDEAMQRILDGSITNVAYDPATASLVHSD